MKLRADFSERVVIRPDDYTWTSSPRVGVERMMLDRIGDEVARATSFVRFAAHTEFDPHAHGGGEEFFVLEGAFGDEHGLYPAGTYVRNPIGTSHHPRIGPDGALIFVKLHQFDARDTAPRVIDTNKGTWHPGQVPGLLVQGLHDFEGEHVALVRWAPNTQFSLHRHFGGEEILVLSGLFIDEHGEYPAGSWIRSPHMSRHAPRSGPDGALIYVKVGHLHPELPVLQTWLQPTAV